MQTIIRPATPADADVIISLIIALADFEQLTPPDEAARARLVADAFATRPRFDIFLAEADGQPVGYAFVFETYSTFLARPTLYLEDLFVLPDYRKHGIGYALFTRCAAEAKRRGCGRMEWVVLNWNENAIAFYERLGAKYLSKWLTYHLDSDVLERLSEP